MIKYKMFSEDNATYMFPSGVIADVETIKEKFPAVMHFAHVLELNGEVCQAVLNFSAFRNMRGIDPALSQEEALCELERLANLPPVPHGPSSEERIAAAMEFSNLMSI